MDLPEAGKEPKALYNTASPEYIDTVGLPLISGRFINAEDTAASQDIAVINQYLAKKIWPGQDPLGRQLHLLGTAEKMVTIVGVVGDAKQYQLSDDPVPQVYVPSAQDAFIFATLVVHTNVEPMSLSKTVKEAVWSIDRDQPVWKIRTMESLLQRDVSTQKLIMTLMGAFAFGGLLLTVMGTYGLISYSVNQRTREIGLRMALGAKPGDVVNMVMSQTARLTGIGIAIGIVAAFGTGRLIQSMLFGIKSSDLASLVISAAAMGAAGYLASFLPARRAARVDPMVALRHE
jgi:predicted permease